MSRKRDDSTGAKAASSHSDTKIRPASGGRNTPAKPTGSKLRISGLTIWANSRTAHCRQMADWRLDQAEQWWNEFRKPRIAENTRNSERYRLQHLQRVVGNKRLKEITNMDLDNYVTARLAAGVGAWSINKEILLWSMILKKAKLWRRIADDYQPLKTQASDIGRALTREQLRQLAIIAATDEDWEAAFYGSVLAASTGLRGGEIKKLRIGEIDLEHRRLRIQRSTTKSDAGARLIELNADATEAATRLLLRASLLKPPATKPEQYLMPKHLSRIAHGAHKGQRGYRPRTTPAVLGYCLAYVNRKSRAARSPFP